MDLKPTAPTTNPADEAAGVVLFRAHERLREVENWLELEAADPRVCPLYRQAKALRKSVAAVLVEVALTASTVEDVPIG